LISPHQEYILRGYLRAALEKTRAGTIEIMLKDISPARHEPRWPWERVEAAMDVIEESA